MKPKFDGTPTHKLYSLDDASHVLGGVSVWTLRKHISSGRVRVVRLGRRVFLDADELERIRREGLPSLRAESGGHITPTTNLNSKEENKNHV